MIQVDMTPVRSSNVDSIGYDEETATLVVQFLDGSVYNYYEVPDEVFHDFLLASSKGKFLWREIRDVYEYERVR
jgi:hypothetical protein